MEDRYSFGLFTVPFPLKSFQSNPFKSKLLDTPEVHSLFRTNLSNLRQSLNTLDLKSLTSEDHISSLYILSICYKFEPFNTKFPELSNYSSSLISKLVSDGDTHSEWDNKINQFFELILTNLKTWENKFYQLYYLSLELFVKKGYRFLKGFNDNIFNNPTFYIILKITKLLTEDFLRNIDLYTDHFDSTHISDNEKRSSFVFPDRNPRTRPYLLSKHLHVLTQIVEHLPKNHQVYSSFHWLKDFYCKLYKFSNKRLFISGFKLLITAFPNEISYNSYYGITVLFENLATNLDITQIHLIINTLIHCLYDLKSSSFAQKSINVNKVAFIFILNASALISKDEPDPVFDCNLFKLFFYLLNTFPNTLKSISSILIGDNPKNKSVYMSMLKGFDILLDYTLKCSSVSDNIESAIPLILVISMMLKSTSGKALSHLSPEKMKSLAKLVVSNFFYNTTPGSTFERNVQSLFNLSLIDGLLNSALRNDVLESLKERCASIADTVSSSFISGDLKASAGVDRKGIEAGVCFEKDVFVRFLCHLTSLKSSNAAGAPLDPNVLQIGLFGLSRLSPQLLESLTQSYAKYYFKGVFSFERDAPFSTFTNTAQTFPLFILHYNVIFPLVSNDPYKLSLFKGMLSLEKSEFWESKIEAIEKNFNDMKLELLTRAETAEKESQTVTNKCIILERQVIELKNELKSSEKNFERIVDQERARFEDVLSQNNKHLLGARNEISVLQKDKNDILSERNRLNDELVKLSEEAKILGSRLCSYKSKYEALSAQLKDFEELSSKFSILDQQHSALLSQHESLSRSYEDCIKKLILIVHCFYCVKRESSEKKAILEDQHHQISSLEVHLQNRDKEIAKFQSHLEDIKHANIEAQEIISRLKNESNEKDALLTKAKGKCDQYRNRIEQLAQSLDNKNRDFQMLQKQIAEKDRDLNGKHQKLKAIADVISGIS